MTERGAGTRVRRGARTAGFTRGRPVLLVPLLVLLIVCWVGVAASPGGSAPTSAGSHAAAVNHLKFFYSVKLHNIPESKNATGVLTGITESTHGTMTGQMILAPPLYGGGRLTGTVGKTNVKFTVASTPGNPCGCISIVFTGAVGAKGVIKGAYVATTKVGSENGTWLASPHATFDCKFASHANHKFVTDEVTFSGKGRAGLLRARSPAVGTWQQFRCVAVGTDQWALQSLVTGKYVTTGVNDAGSLKGLLRAQSSKIGALQKFSFVPVPSCSCLALLGTNLRFVTAELKDAPPLYGILRARSAKIGPWTKFDVSSI
jgi:hypothetical protein